MARFCSVGRKTRAIQYSSVKLFPTNSITAAPRTLPFQLPVVSDQPQICANETKLNHNVALTLKPRLHDTTCCQTGLTTGVSCIQTFNRLSNPFDNRFDKRLCQTGCTTRFDNRLYPVNGV